MPASEFKKRYNHNKPQPASNILLEVDGFQQFKPKGSIRAHVIQWDELNNNFPANQFIGKWGGLQRVAVGDILAMPMPECDEVYAIPKELFEETYQHVYQRNTSESQA